jgi:hypothetical protein
LLGTPVSLREFLVGDAFLRSAFCPDAKGGRVIERSFLSEIIARRVGAGGSST